MTPSRRVGNAAPRASESEYALGHQAPAVPEFYDQVVYRPGSYDSFIWELQQPLLTDVARRVASSRSDASYLDFACGTGRVLSTLEGEFASATGLDTSPQMLDAARDRAAGATLVCGDVLEDPEIVGRDFDMITAFRFFVNTEPRMRLPLLSTLAGRLRSDESRLVFNMHGNAWSTYQLTSLRHVVRGYGRRHTMTYRSTKALIEQAGLEIESWRGYGLTVKRMHDTPLRGLSRWIDRRASGSSALGLVSRDLMFVCRPAR